MNNPNPKYSLRLISYLLYLYISLQFSPKIIDITVNDIIELSYMFVSGSYFFFFFKTKDRAAK